MPATEELYQQVVTEGRRRRSRLVAIVSMVAAIALASIVVVVSGTEPDQVLTADRSTAVSTTTASTSDAPSSTAPSGGTERAEPTTSPSAATTTAPTLVCRNSTKPECGEFRWDPAPPENQPITASVSYSPTNPRVGDTVTFTVHGEDADAVVACFSLRLSDGTYLGLGMECVRPAIGCRREPQGPWDTPTPSPSSVDRVFSHVFTESGQATVTAQVGSQTPSLPQSPDEPRASLCPRIYDLDPFASATEAAIVLHVWP